MKKLSKTTQNLTIFETRSKIALQNLTYGLIELPKWIMEAIFALGESVIMHIEQKKKFPGQDFNFKEKLKLSEIRI